MSGDELSVHAAAREAPDRLALIAGDRSFTYAELAALTERSERWLLRHLNERPGRVAVVAVRTPEIVSVLLALFELGATACLIHPRSTEPERTKLIELLDPAFAVDHESAEEGLRRAGPHEEHMKPRAEALPALGPTDQSLEAILAVVPTSGSRGRPKGVLLSRRAFLSSARASASNLGWTENDRWLLTLPMAHVGGLSILVRALIARRCIVLAPPGRFDPRETARSIDRHGVTLVSLVPAMLDAMLDVSPAWQPPDGLRAVLLGGAPAGQRLLTRAADRGVPVLTTYGLTETCSQVTTQRYGTVNRGELGSGSPLEDVELRIMDGEIQVRGPVLLNGYLEEGGVSSGLDADGWLSTGDEGELDEAGRLHVRGRLDRRIVTGGENVDPIEVETALVSQASIRQAHVFGVEDDRWGQIVAAALVAERTRPTGEELGRHLREILAPHKVPRLVAYVDRLPTTAAGKVDRTATEAEARATLSPL